MLRRLLPTVIACFLLASACSSGSSGIATRLDEYEIDLGTSSAPAGEQTFDVRNEGEIAHQLIVLRTEEPPDELPVKDGVVRTGTKTVDEIGKIELLSSGASQDLSVSLEPGPHVLICNIAGHYASGMYVRFRVT